MEHASTYILLFITLLQLCRTELTGSWYNANVINDGDFSPKPISEIFSTEPPPFSPTNPIVVLSQSTTPSSPISTSVSPGSSSSFSTPSITPEFISTFSTTPSTILTQTSYDLSSSQQPFSQSTFPEPKPTFDLGKPFPFSFNQEKIKPNNPDYFQIYQQAQNSPPTAPQQTFSNFPISSTYSTSPSPTFTLSSTFQPELSSPQSTFSTFPPDVSSRPPSTLSTFQPEVSSISTTLSTFRPESTTPQTTLFFTPSSESTFPPNLPSSPQPRSPSSTPKPNTIRTANTVFPCSTTPQPTGTNSLSRFPSLRIRMVAPSGSITNVNINPIVSTTTKRPTTRRTTTTRRPTTTRTRRTKRNRNTYDACVNTCEDRGRNPICAAPLAQTPIDGNKLKGFPSICHMACHNSFRKDQYEMLVEGRCGKLRTRIKTLNSDKLKRVELNKAQYTIVNEPQTVLEFSSLPRK